MIFHYSLSFFFFFFFFFLFVCLFFFFFVLFFFFVCFFFFCFLFMLKTIKNIWCVKCVCLMIDQMPQFNPLKTGDS